MPGADTKQIYIRNPTAGFSLQPAGASSQQVSTGVMRNFTVSADRFGPFEPGDYECTCVSEQGPGAYLFGAVAIKIGDSEVTAVINVDHFPVPSFATFARDSITPDTKSGFSLYAFKFRIENPNNYISMLTTFVVAPTISVVASFQKLN